MNIIPKRIAIFIIILTLWLSGCMPKEIETSDREYKTNELVLAIGSEPENGFDPTTGWGRYGSPLFQSTLLKFNSELEIGYDLATDFSVEADGTVWIVTIRDDVTFSDGMPLTSNDVQFTYETAAQSGSVIDLQNLQSVEALDPTTVVFTLKEAQSTFIHSLATIGIVPHHLYDEHYAQAPIGSGPYKLVQWDRGVQLIVEENTEYYGDIPYFKKLTFLFINEDAALAAAKTGQVDMTSIPASFSKTHIPGMRLQSMQTVDNRGIMFPYVKSGSTTKDGHPIGNDVTADLAIRQAINVALDRQALIDGILEGHGTPAYSLNDGLPWWHPSTVIEDGDMDEARRILTEAGWIDVDGDGVLEKDALPAKFKLIYPASDVTRQSLAIAAADMIKPLGIHIEVEGKSWNDINTMMYSNAVLFGWGSHSPIEMYHVYSSNFSGVDSFNPGFYTNSVVDEYMEKAMTATDQDEAMSFWQKAQWDGETGLSAQGDAPWAWLVNVNHLYLIREDLYIGEPKIQPHGHGWPITDNIEEWRWLK